MNTVYLSDNTVFIMKDDGEILTANECAIKYKETVINFIEMGGLYAYSEFFIEGTWPDEYYEEGEKANEYNGVRLKMLRGDWYSMNDLIKVLNSELPVFEEIDSDFEDFEEIDSDFENKLKNALDSLKKIRENKEETKDSYKIEF